MGLEASMIEVPTRDESLLALTGGRSEIDCVGTYIPGSRLIVHSGEVDTLGRKPAKALLADAYLHQRSCGARWISSMMAL